MTDTDVGSDRDRLCSSCGAEAVAGASFCGECGDSLTKASAASEPPSSPPPSCGSSTPGFQPAAPLPTPPAPPSTGGQVPAGEPAIRRKGGIKRIVIAVVALVLIVGGVIAAVALPRSSRTGSASNSDNSPVRSIHADPSSPSYRDGYGEGRQLSSSGVYMSWSGGITAAPAYVCVQHDRGMPSGDNLSQSLLGCVAAVKALGGATGTPPSSVNSSPPTGSTGSTGTNAGHSVPLLQPAAPPTTTTTTNPPTTTTTISPQAAYQAGYQAGQATFTGQSPSQIQTYCTGVLTSYVSPSISQNPALAAQFMAGCVAGAS